MTSTLLKGDFVRRSLAVFACFIAFAVLGAAPAGADGVLWAHTNYVAAENSNSATPVVHADTAFSLDQNGSSVTDTNVAYAHSFDCTGCRSVAVALQIVVVEGSPSNYQPQNGAVAVNDNCQSCQTFAYAHQYVIQTPVVHLDNVDKATVNQVLSIQSQVSAVAHSSADFATMSSQLDQLSLNLYNVVYQFLQNHGDQGHGRDSEHRLVQETD
jgi:hypothetical protein